MGGVSFTARHHTLVHKHGSIVKRKMVIVMFLFYSWTESAVLRSTQRDFVVLYVTKVKGALFRLLTTQQLLVYPCTIAVWWGRREVNEMQGMEACDPVPESCAMLQQEKQQLDVCCVLDSWGDIRSDWCQGIFPTLAWPYYATIHSTLNEWLWECVAYRMCLCDSLSYSHFHYPFHRQTKTQC